MQQKKITKSQAVQVNETDKDEGQINRVTLKRPVHQGRKMLTKGALFHKSLLFTPCRAMLLPTTCYVSERRANYSTVQHHLKP